MPILLVVLLFVLLIFAVLFFTALFLTKRAAGKLIKAFRLSSLPRSVTGSLQESRRYGQLIVQTARQYPPGPLRDRLHLALRPVDQWLANLTRLEQGLEKLYSQRNLARELRQTNFEIDGLRRRLLTADAEESAFVRQLLRSKQQHLAALKELQRFQVQAELKIQKIASDLGATHAEMLLIIARGDFNENRFRRLDENLQEHLSSMKDVLAAMDELGYSSAAG